MNSRFTMEFSIDSRGEQVLIRISVVMLTLALFATPAFGQSRAQEGAVAGGIAGAILGGIAGHQNDETPEGIAIGGAVGAIAGGLLGRSQDDQMMRDYRYQQYETQQYQERVQAAVSIQDAISLSRSGLSDNLIVNQIRTNGVQQKIGVNEIITLHQNGVSELVINAMQQTQQAGPSPTVVSQPRPVVVQQRPIVFESRPIVFDHRPTYRPQPTIVLERHGSHYHSTPVRSSHNYGHSRHHR